MQAGSLRSESVNDELEEKTGRLVEMLCRENIDAVLLNAQHNFAWLTAGGKNGVDLSRENGAASLLVTRYGERFVLASVIEIERMLEEEISEDDFDPLDYSWQGEKAASSLIIDKAKFVLETGAKLATDIPIDAATPIIENKIAACRFVLTENEIERYEKLGRDAGFAIRQVVEQISPGETESEIAEKLRHEVARGGMSSVVTLVAADERIAKYRHPAPTDKRWNKTLLLVTCARRHGLIASLSRIICIGGVSDEMQQRTEAAAYVNAKLLDATRPGATGSELYATASNAYAEKGFGDEIDRHHQGGATGYKTREWAAHPKSGEAVQVNQAFAWNPSITGTKVEETAIVKESGVQTVTASPDFPVITTTIDGRDYHSPGILNI